MSVDCLLPEEGSQEHLGMEIGNTFLPEPKGMEVWCWWYWCLFSTGAYLWTLCSSLKNHVVSVELHSELARP